MELEEAKEILKNIIDDEVIGTYCIEIQKEGVPCDINCESQECYLHIAIETVLQELDRLQKENEELKHAVVGIDLDNTYISKDEIRKMKANIQMIANGNKVIENTIKYRVQMALLDDLLKEE